MILRSLHKPYPNLLSVLLIVLLAANYFAPFADLDFTWQIRTGAEIIRTGQLQPPETFSYTIAGQRSSQFEWLYEVTVWAVWSGFGYGGLKLLKTILVTAPLVIMSLQLKRGNVRWPGILLALLIAFVVLSSVWNLRPLYCTTIGLLLVSGWLHDHCAGRRSLSLWLPVVMAVWGNVHPAVIIGQALLAGAIAWEWLNRWLRLNAPLSRRACVHLTVVGGLGLAGSCLAPAPIERLLFVFRPELAHPIQRVFMEMQPLYACFARSPLTTTLTYGVAGLVALAVVLRFRQFRLWEVAVLVGLAGLANLAIRSLQDWLLVMMAIGGPHLALNWRQLVARRRGLRKAFCVRHPTLAGLALPYARAALRGEHFCRRMLNSESLRLQWGWPAAAVAVLACVSLVPAVARDMPIREAKECPTEALDWIEAHHLHGRFFAPPDYGSYVSWRLGDQAQSYVYTRGFIFPPELLEDSHYLPQLDAQWQRRLARVLSFGTDYFLLETTGPRGRLWYWLRTHGARPLYCDAQTVLVDAVEVRKAIEPPTANTISHRGSLSQEGADPWPKESEPPQPHHPPKVPRRQLSNV
jgi:hypothetical protein